jgi:hypothetical protein
MPYALSRSCAARQTKEVTVKKLVATESVSLDGVIESPGGRIPVTRPELRVSLGIQHEEIWRRK